MPRSQQREVQDQGAECGAERAPVAAEHHTERTEGRGMIMLPDEHGDEHLPPPRTDPVIVRPIQPEKSRTLRLAWKMTIWPAIVAVAPDILSVFVWLVTNDP